MVKLCTYLQSRSRTDRFMHEVTKLGAIGCFETSYFADYQEHRLGSMMSGWTPIFGVAQTPPKRVVGPQGSKSVIWESPHWMIRTTSTEASTTTGGGDEDELFEQGDVTFVLVSSALVLLMIPGVGFFYSGLTRAMSALSLILISFWSVALVSLQVRKVVKA